MANMNAAKPVTILSGFLGAGKTSFLNEMIRSKPDTRYFIIENEFGEENIDSSLIVASEDSVFPMASGCVCCSLNDQLFDVLETLWDRRDEFDELIIETTGIADPAFVALSFVENPGVARCFKLERVICLIDPVLIESELKNTEEALQQIAFSDILMVTKTDLVSESQLLRVDQLLNEINPWATVFSGSTEDGFPFHQILDLNRERLDNDLLLGLNYKTHEKADHHEHDHHEHEHEHHDGEKHHHHHDITSLSFTYEEPFDMEKLRDKLLAFLNYRTDQVYRVKGIFNVYGAENKIIVQSVASLLTIRKGEPWQPDDWKGSRMVFIGKNLFEEDFSSLMNACLK